MESLNQSTMMDVQVKCKCCKHTYTLTVNDMDLMLYRNTRIFAQDAFPYLTPADRELLISGICDTCWNRLFGDEE